VPLPFIATNNKEEGLMHTESDRRVAGLMLFLLGGLAGTALALRWSRRGERESVGSTLQGVHGVLDDAVATVESTVGYMRRLVAPVHELLEEASALAGGVQRTMESYRDIGRRPVEPGPGYVPSMAPEPTTSH
jgi:hypothetical protein